jgi:sulfur carrier protein
VKNIFVNGEVREIDAGATIADVVRLLSRTAGVAVARNGEVVPRSAWTTTTVETSDRLEVLTVAPGG